MCRQGDMKWECEVCCWVDYEMSVWEENNGVSEKGRSV